MKTKFFYMGSAIICCALAFGTVSCSDDDDAKEFKIEESIVSNGITTDENATVINIPVSCDGQWEASFPESCDWAGTLVSQGKDGEQVVIAIDQTDGTARNTTLTVKNGDKTISIPVKQTVNRENTGEYLYYSGRGLGRGYDPKNNKYTTSAVLNFKAIEKLAEQNPIDFEEVLYFGKVNISEGEGVVTDSIEEKKDTLGVKLSIGVAYSAFHFGLEGAVNAHEERFTYSVTRRFTGTYPLWAGEVQYFNLATAYQDWLDEGRPQKTEDGETDWRAGVLSIGFRRVVKDLNDKVKAANATTYKGNKEISDACGNILRNFSPLVVTKVTLGGAYLLELEIDSLKNKELFGVNEAKVTADFKAGLFSLDAKVAVTYGKDVKEIVDGSNYKVLIKGGTDLLREGIYSNFRKMEFENREPITNWYNSLTFDQKTNSGTVEAIDWDYVPIWNFFSPAAAVVLREYIYDQPELKDNEIMKSFKY